MANALDRMYLLILLCCLYRIVLALSVQTAFSPDEWWQSLEVAHAFVFGEGASSRVFAENVVSPPFMAWPGALTWEWQVQLRSFLHPSLFAALFATLKRFTDDALYYQLVPKILQGFLAAAQDVAVYSAARRHVGPAIAPFAVPFPLDVLRHVAHQLSF